MNTLRLKRNLKHDSNKSVQQPFIPNDYNSFVDYYNYVSRRDETKNKIEPNSRDIETTAGNIKSFIRLFSKYENKLLIETSCFSRPISENSDDSMSDSFDLKLNELTDQCKKSESRVKSTLRSSLLPNSLSPMVFIIHAFLTDSEIMNEGILNLIRMQLQFKIYLSTNQKSRKALQL